MHFLNFVDPSALEPGTGYQHRCTSITNIISQQQSYKLLVFFSMVIVPILLVSNKNLQSDELL